VSRVVDVDRDGGRGRYVDVVVDGKERVGGWIF
jgi:hypothetical protein